MKRLNRYICSSVISAVILVIFVLVAMEIFIGFSSEFPDVGTGNYGIFHASLVVLLLLPINIYQFFPIAGLVGTLIGLGTLESRSELIVMRASGVSILRISWSVIRAAAILLIIAIILGESIGPYAKHMATTIKANAMSGGQALYTRHGIWVRNNSDFIHIGTVNPKGRLQNIARYQFNSDGRLMKTSFAKDATFQHGKWLFQDISSSMIGNKNVTSTHYSSQEWGLKFKPRLLGLINIDSNERSLPELYAYINYLKHSGLRSNQYRIDFWQRVFLPISVIAMILLAIPFIFGPLRSVTMGLRIVVGTVVGFTFYIFNQFIGPLTTVYQFPPIAVALIPTILILIFGYLLLLRVM